MDERWKTGGWHQVGQLSMVRDNSARSTSKQQRNEMKGVVLRLFCAVVLQAIPRYTGAQAPELGDWNQTMEASANLLFGAAEGRVGALSAGANRADSTLELRADVRFSYADAKDNDGETSVTARTSRLSFGIDRHPFARISPFAFGSLESSLQQRVARRYAAGAGAKLTIIPPGDNKTDVSLALLWEQTNALHPAPDVDPTVTLARWSLRARASRRLTNAISLDHATLWQPATDDLGRYTTETRTRLVITVNSSLSLTATLRDRYDSEAVSRGSASNHDGQVLFGVLAKF